MRQMVPVMDMDEVVMEASDREGIDEYVVPFMAVLSNFRRKRRIPPQPRGESPCYLMAEEPARRGGLCPGGIKPGGPHRFQGHPPARGPQPRRIKWKILAVVTLKKDLIPGP
ncbi:Hypothetical protein NTJ_02995 [Nesidiocoris tenuis]|uniref:Uncharacterized protein n=1 Tax=Nesidiocoris tenuis TaxID=355587 RepID=A0ABN7AIM8_9HEMI|nr:Hypothetical protein NTJ_02995 [Nesidiocoris tenuis]